MFSSNTIATFLIGLSQMSSSIAQPVTAPNNPEPVDPGSFIITHNVSDFFPHSKSDLTPFDVDVQFMGYNASTQSWLTGLDPASGSSDKEKAQIITAAAFAKPFDTNDPDMTADVNSLLAAVNGNATILHKRQPGSSFLTGSGHAVRWAACASFFSCVSGTTCQFQLTIGSAPRSQCQAVGGSNCCISWSNYNVRAGFFTSTWTTCNDEFVAQQLTDGSCEGYGGDAQGGDVCLSNRAGGCT
ncbi:MAG: hypothetical protein OHK93_001965 [Ramalina farinacea]|uniref:WD-like domain-containing protein n=1 Tax=Ramalina farinacea TaxID=258253 RepID=A0AA43QQF6_9LECA|nr:hypothetical protein [Ramalina farinacea]